MVCVPLKLVPLRPACPEAILTMVVLGRVGTSCSLKRLIVLRHVDASLNASLKERKWWFSIAVVSSQRVIMDN